MTAEPGDFGKRIARHRNAAGLSQRDLAELADVSLSYLRKLEQGSSEPSGLSIVRTISRRLGLDPRLLLGHGFPRRNGSASLGLSRPVAVVVTDWDLRITSCNDTFADLLPGLDVGTNLAAWVFEDPRAGQIVANLSALRRAIVWWLESSPSVADADAARVRATSSTYARMAAAAYPPTARHELLRPGAIRLWTPGGADSSRYTLHLFVGATDAAVILMLTPHADS